MKTFKQFTKWLSKTASESRTQTETSYYDYTPSKDTSNDYLKEFYKKENEWKTELKTKLANFNSLQHISAGTITADTYNGSITTNRYSKLLVDGRDVMQEIDEMRDALLLLKREVDMEAKYPRLREIKDEYEQELAKYKTFDILKESK